VEVSGKTIRVSFEEADSLQANTTYVFHFGNAIRDYNEGNILRDFTYTFSTGPALDSLELTGRVLLAENGKVDSTLTVMLHRDLADSAVRKTKPQYAVRLDQQGNFRFRNLPAGRFAIYALGDAGTVRMYQNEERQLFAFTDSPVVVRPGRDTAAAPLTLYAYRRAEATNEATGGPGTTRGPAPAANRLVFNTNLANNQQDLLSTLQLNFATPLRTFDSTGVILSTDSTFNTTSYRYNLDSARKTLSISTQWREGTRYNLVLNRDFATDTTGRRLLKTDTLFFNTRRLNEYGSLTVRMKNIPAGANPVLLFVQNNQVVFSAPIASGIFRQTLTRTGEYEIRILDDRNKNGKWDPGDFFRGRKQPELIRTLDRKLNIKADTDNEFEL
jgi:hypothetical protein